MPQRRRKSQATNLKPLIK